MEAPKGFKCLKEEIVNAEDYIDEKEYDPYRPSYIGVRNNKIVVDKIVYQTAKEFMMDNPYIEAIQCEMSRVETMISKTREEISQRREKSNEVYTEVEKMLNLQIIARKKDLVKRLTSKLNGLLHAHEIISKVE